MVEVAAANLGGEHTADEIHRQRCRCGRRSTLRAHSETSDRLEQSPLERVEIGRELGLAHGATLIPR